MKAVCLFLFFSLASLAFAGGPGEKYMVLRGKVTDVRSNESLAGVKVSVKGQEVSTYTDFDGNFTLIVAAGSSYTVDFEMLSYEPLAASVQLQGRLASDLSVSLKERQ